MRGPLLVSGCSTGGNHWLEEDELRSLHSDFLTRVMNLQVISGSEALGKQEGTSASPVLGRVYTWGKKGSCEEPHEPITQPSLASQTWGQLSNCKL